MPFIVQVNQVHVTVNGAPVSFQGVSAPRIIDGHVYARVCTVSAPMKVKMMTYMVTEGNWVQVDGDGIQMKLPIDSNTVTINGRETTGTLPARLIKGEGFFPLRQVAQALGKIVSWDRATRTVVIRDNPRQPSRD